MSEIVRYTEKVDAGIVLAIASLEFDAEHCIVVRGEDAIKASPEQVENMRAAARWLRRVREVKAVGGAS